MNDFTRIRTSNLSSEGIKNSITKAIDFLYENQLDYGEFKTFACSDNMLTKNCYFDSSSFVTTFVVYSIKDVRDKKVEIMTNKTINFLLSEQESGGIWRFWTSRNTKDIDPDFDDISVVSATLTIFNRSFDENIKLFDSYKNEDGVVQTWLRDTEDNEIDCEVNANILFYFGSRNIENGEICEFINKQILQENYSCCIYCENKIFGKNYLPLFYLVSRAYKHGNLCLNESKEHILHETLNLQRIDGSFGSDLDTALALNTLLNFNYHGNGIDWGINALLQDQLDNGSWRRYNIFLGSAPYYGSEELTTALAVEALQKYLQIQITTKRE
jgi:hypothetical protein